MKNQIIFFVFIFSLATSSCKKTDECVELYGENYEKIKYTSYDTSFLKYFYPYNNLKEIYFKKYLIKTNEITGGHILEFVDTIVYKLVDSFDYYEKNGITPDCFDVDSVLNITKGYQNQYDDRFELNIDDTYATIKILGHQSNIIYFQGETPLIFSDFDRNTSNNTIENVNYKNVKRNDRLTYNYEYILMNDEFGILQIRKFENNSDYFLYNRILIF
jgi:hypothetical protein